MTKSKIIRRMLDPTVYKCLYNKQKMCCLTNRWRQCMSWKPIFPIHRTWQSYSILLFRICMSFMFYLGRDNFAYALIECITCAHWWRNYRCILKLEGNCGKILKGIIFWTFGVFDRLWRTKSVRDADYFGHIPLCPPGEIE